MTFNVRHSFALKKDTQKGQAMLSAIVFFVFISLVIVSGLASPVVREAKTSADIYFSKKSFFLAESGVEDLHYRLLHEIAHLDSGTYDIPIGGDYVTVDLATLIASKRTVTATGNASRRKRIIQFTTDYSNTITFNSGMQFGKGGLLFQGGGSWVNGSIISAGPITGTNTNLVTNGGAISSGSSGLVNNIRFATAGHPVYAHNITNSFISGDAYYTTISNTTVNGMSHPNSPDAPVYPLPITDAMIDKFKKTAETGGVYGGSCPYNISSGLVNLGPIKIPCSSFNISGNAVVYINGPVWVTGDITISNTASVSVGAGAGLGNSAPLIADNPLNRISSSKISLNTAATVTSSSPNSYVMFISQNNDAETGGLQDAINFRSTGSNSKILLYAPHGHINAQTTNSTNVLQLISGYKATLSTFSAVLSAKATPTNLTFTTGLLQIWGFEKWKEI